MKNELYHSDVYLGADYSDGLTHFKYIKRYKGRNGKWTYVYADKETHNGITKNQSGSSFDKDMAGYAKNRADRYRRNADRYRSLGKKADSDWKRDLYADREREYRKKTAYESKSVVELNKRSKQRAEEAYQKIQDNSVKSLTQKSIDSGKNKIKSLLNKVDKAVGVSAKKNYEEAKKNESDAKFRAQSTAKAANAQNNARNNITKNYSKDFANSVLTGKFDSKDPEYKTKTALRNAYNLSGQAESGSGGTRIRNNNVTSLQRAAGEARNYSDAKAKTQIAKSKYDKTLLGRYENTKKKLKRK